jgi:hypothetical protein
MNDDEIIKMIFKLRKFLKKLGKKLSIADILSLLLTELASIISYFDDEAIEKISKRLKETSIDMKNKRNKKNE